MGIATQVQGKACAKSQHWESEQVVFRECKGLAWAEECRKGGHVARGVIWVKIGKLFVCPDESAISLITAG